MIRKRFYAVLICLAFTAGCAGTGSAEMGAPAATDAAQVTGQAGASQVSGQAGATQAGGASAADTPAPGAASGGQPADNGGPVTVTDMKGRTITLTEPVTRIIALTAGDCENLYAISAGDKLVGRGEYCDYPPEVLGVQSVQSGAETNLEQIISLKPQVLLMGAMDQNEEQVKALENAGIRCVISDAQNIEGVYTEIQMLGALMGRQKNAEDLINKMKSDFAAVSAGANANKGKTIYFEVSPLQFGLWTAGSGTFMDEIAKMLGLTNCFADVSGWAQISEEQVIERNPDYILTIGMYTGQGPKPDEEIMGRAGWGSIKAVKNRAILNLQNNELSRPSYRLAEGAKLLSAFISEHKDS